MAIKLTDKEKKVILAAQFQADASLGQLAKWTGLREHVVHYAKASLIERRLLRPWLAINHFALGLEQFDIFFSLSSSSSSVKEKLLQALASETKVLWYAELGGDFQYALSLYTRSVAEAVQFLERLASKSKALLVRKQVSIVVALTLFKKKVLAAANSPLAAGSVSFRRPAQTEVLDRVDEQILAGLYDYAGRSQRELALGLQLPRSSVDLRVRRLRERGILLRHIYHVDTDSMGFLSFKLPIYARGVRPELHQKLLRYAETSRHVVNFGVCLGSWDYELGVEAVAAEEVGKIVADLYDRFGADIDRVPVLPVFKRNVSKRFMRAAG